MPKVFAASDIALHFSAVTIPYARAQRSEEGLLAVWEQAQKKNDPSTVKFEKVKDRRYHFAMKHFPFDGDLLVRNVVIEDFSAVNQNGISMGTVEVELQGVTHDFHRTLARSYAQWNMSNTLYWDPKAQQWLTSENATRRFLNRASSFSKRT